MTISLPQLGTNLLTHSAMTKFKTCPKSYYFAYVLGLRRDRDQTALRMGSAIHLGLDLLAKGMMFEMVMALVREGYAILPKWVESGGEEAYYDWQIEQVKVEELLRGYATRWAMDKIEIVESETAFELTIASPDGGRSPNYHFAGKIDKIIRLPDGRLAVMEHKSTVSDLDIESGYWDILGLDTQISGYMHASRERGFDVQTVLYDVIRKPSIKPYKATPMENRKYKKDGTLYANQNERNETPEEFGDRLRLDIESNWDRYYARREIPRTDGDLEEFQAELWQIQQTVNEATKKGRFFRNTSACKSSYGMCEYIDLCTQRYSPNDGIPAGFVQIENVHPELTA